MSVKTLSDIFKVGADLLNTTMDPVTGTILAQTGDINQDTSGFTAVTGNQTEIYGQPGFVSRPSPAVVNPGGTSSAAQVVTITRSDRDAIIGIRDVRYQANAIGNLQPGESAMVATGGDGTGQARVLTKGDGTISLYTTLDGTADGTGMSFSIGPSAGTGGTPGFNMQADFGSLLFDGTGFHVTTSGGAGLSLSTTSVPGIPPPFAAALSSVAKLTAGSVTLDGTFVSAGPGALSVPPGVPMDAVVNSAALLAQIVILIQGISSALTTVLATGSTSTGPVVFAGLPALIAALTALETTFLPLGPTQLLISSTSLTGTIAA